MVWPKRTKGGLEASEKQSFAKGIFRKCDGCGETLDADVLEKNFEVCPLCQKHHRLSVRGWRSLMLDAGKLSEWAKSLAPKDPLAFFDGKSYTERVQSAQKSSKSNDAIEIGEGMMNHVPVAYGAFNFGFMGGSMGSVVGEKIARLFEGAIEANLPVVLLQASGGARMQEGTLSLMQMAKTVAARERLRDARLPFISVLLHPTTGGVAASFAFLGDVNIAEPQALIGFAGPRVIETTIRQTLPEGFQKSEFLHDHGMVDRIVSRLEMKREISAILSLLLPQPPVLPPAAKSRRKVAS
jgi:acetyl-CoA carboxylase carboxyl transferase subunit beta